MLVIGKHHRLAHDPMKFRSVCVVKGLGMMPMRGWLMALSYTKRGRTSAPGYWCAEQTKEATPMFSVRALNLFAIAVAVSSVWLTPLPARASVILLGSDYLTTVPPTFFVGLGDLQGLPFGPGNTDTVVQRQANCSLDLGTASSSCTIPIEMVALSLQSTTNPLVLVRESPTLATTGSMTMVSSDSGTGGTFTSFFDVLFELSFDGGSTFAPAPNPLSLTAPPTLWTIIEPLPPAVLVDGLVGDQAANRHTNKGTCPGLFGDNCFDFFLVDRVTEEHPGEGVHSAIPAFVPVPEPATLALFGVGLVLLALSRRRKNGVMRRTKPLKSPWSVPKPGFHGGGFRESAGRRATLLGGDARSNIAFEGRGKRTMKIASSLDRAAQRGR